MKNNIFLCLFFAIQLTPVNLAFQSVCIFNDKLCIDVPKAWTRQDHYSKFSDYEVIFDTRFIDRDNGSQVTVKIADKKYNSKRLTVEARLKKRWQSDSLLWRHVSFMDSGIEARGQERIGFIKYQFLLHGKKHYMVESLFSDQDGNMYDVEIYSLVLSSGEFKATADHIYQSLTLK